MASIEEGGDSGHKKGPGVKKAKKLSTRVDMTPMVDLGFLLITFFVFTATMSSPTALDLNMPKDVNDDKDKTEVKQSSTLTIMLSKGNQVYYYEGMLEVTESKNNFKSSNFKDIRKVILDKKKDVISRGKTDLTDPQCIAERKQAQKDGDPDWENACLAMDFVVVIKPDKDATYKNVVDILDEMTINQVKRYAMIKIEDVEVELIKKTEESAGIK